MEQLISQVVSNLPNLAVAVAVLYWQKQTIDQLLAHQRQLLDKLIEMVTRAENVASSAANAPLAVMRTNNHGGD